MDSRKRKQPEPPAVLSSHDQRRLRENFWGVNDCINDLLKYFKQVAQPKGGTARDVVELLTAPAIDDTTDLNRHIVKFVDVLKSLNCYSELYGDAQSRDAQYERMAAIPRQLRAELEHALVYLHTNKSKEATRLLVAQAPQRLGECQEFKTLLQTIVDSFCIGDDNADADDSSSYDSDYVPEQDDDADNPFIVSDTDEAAGAAPASQVGVEISIFMTRIPSGGSAPTTPERSVPTTPERSAPTTPERSTSGHIRRTAGGRGGAAPRGEPESQLD